MQKIKDDRTLRGLFDKENWENLPKLVADSPSIRRHIGLPILSASTPDESFFQRMLFKYWAKVGDINSKALELDYKDSVLLPLLKELHELKLPKNVTTFLQELALSPAAQLFLDVFANKRKDKQSDDIFENLTNQCISESDMGSCRRNVIQSDTFQRQINYNNYLN